MAGIVHQPFESIDGPESQTYTGGDRHSEGKNSKLWAFVAGGAAVLLAGVGATVWATQGVEGGAEKTEPAVDAPLNQGQEEPEAAPVASPDATEPHPTSTSSTSTTTEAKSVDLQPSGPEILNRAGNIGFHVIADRAHSIGSDPVTRLNRQDSFDIRVPAVMQGDSTETMVSTIMNGIAAYTALPEDQTMQWLLMPAYEGDTRTEAIREDLKKIHAFNGVFPVTLERNPLSIHRQSLIGTGDVQPTFEQTTNPDGSITIQLTGGEMLFVTVEPQDEPTQVNDDWQDPEWNPTSLEVLDTSMVGRFSATLVPNEFSTMSLAGLDISLINVNTGEKYFDSADWNG